jgi:hypothetical protein
MNAPFSRRQQDETESVWFKVAHAVVGLLVLVALLMLAASGWNNHVAASDMSAKAAVGTPEDTDFISATKPLNTGVPDAAHVFRGSSTPAENLPATF